jgi:hypothetical protein
MTYVRRAKGRHGDYNQSARNLLPEGLHLFFV